MMKKRKFVKKNKKVERKIIHNIGFFNPLVKSLIL